MASINKQAISGDLDVGRNLTTGGGLAATGASTFSGNVTVKGFLEAPNIRESLKGVFDGEQALCGTYPKVKTGWWALVYEKETSSDGTTSLKYYLYDAKDGEWENVGLTTLTVNAVNDYLNGVADSLGERVDSVEYSLGTLSGQINGSGGDAGLAGKVEALEKSVESLEENSGTNEAIEALEKKVTNIQTDINDLAENKYDKTDGEELDKKIQALTEDIASIIGKDGSDGDSLASLKEIITLMQDGKWGGSIRFNGMTELGDTTLVTDKELVDDEEGDFIGVLWLTDKKMFVGAKGRVYLDCGKQIVEYTYYTHWDKAEYYMETPGEEGGLWKEKVYIHSGAVYVWKECEDQLVKAGKTYHPITEEQLDKLMEDFKFVEIGNLIRKIKTEAEDPLGLCATYEDETVTLKGKVALDDIGADEVNEMFEEVANG